MRKVELSDVVREALDVLGEDQKMAVLLNKFEDMSYAEIAEVMGRSEAGRQVAAGPRRTNLREQLEPYLRTGTRGRGGMNAASRGSRPGPGWRAGALASRSPCRDLRRRGRGPLLRGVPREMIAAAGRRARDVPCRWARCELTGAAPNAAGVAWVRRGGRAGPLSGADPPPLPADEAREGPGSRWVADLLLDARAMA